MEKQAQVLKMYEVAKIIELEPIDVSEAVGESYKFRIEILQEGTLDGQYHARVYRRETYRLQPTFPLTDGEPENACWDQEILVVDEARDWEHCTGQSVDEVLAQVIQRIHEIFNLTPQSHG
jgi:hypothetical protein